MIRSFCIGFIFCLLLACTPTPHQNLADINMALGLQALRQQDPVAAKSYLLKALSLAPDNVRIQMAWGYYLRAVGEDSAAQQTYFDALMQAPEDPEVQEDYGVFLYQEGHYQEALDYFLKAAQHPHYLYTGMAYQNASLTAMQLGDAHLAEHYHQLALAEGGS